MLTRVWTRCTNSGKSSCFSRNFSVQGALQGPFAGLGVAHAAAPNAVRSVKGFCPFCQVRCTWYAQVRGNVIESIAGDPGNRWTGGAMCPKGLSLIELVGSPYRLVRPLLRVTRGKDEWKAISYAEAIDLVAQKLSSALKKPDGAKRVALTAPLWDCRESELAALMTLRKAIDDGVKVRELATDSCTAIFLSPNAPVVKSLAKGESFTIGDATVEVIGVAGNAATIKITDMRVLHRLFGYAVLHFQSRAWAQVLAQNMCFSSQIFRNNITLTCNHMIFYCL